MAWIWHRFRVTTTTMCKHGMHSSSASWQQWARAIRSHDVRGKDDLSSMNTTPPWSSFPVWWEKNLSPQDVVYIAAIYWDSKDLREVSWAFCGILHISRLPNIISNNNNFEEIEKKSILREVQQLLSKDGSKKKKKSTYRRYSLGLIQQKCS